MSKQAVSVFRFAVSGLLCLSACAIGVAGAEPARSYGPVTPAIIEEVLSYLASDIVQMSVRDQNRKYAGRTSADIEALDRQWRAETEAKSKPLISATLSNPLSAYLTRVQAHSNGLFTEIFVMDDKGLNVGQSSISSDYWQGDEPKWQKTFSMGAGAVFVDAPEYDAESGTMRVQVNMSVDDVKTGKAIGAATFQVNLNEMRRR